MESLPAGDVNRSAQAVGRNLLSRRVEASIEDGSHVTAHSMILSERLHGMIPIRHCGCTPEQTLPHVHIKVPDNYGRDNEHVLGLFLRTRLTHSVT